MYDSVNLLKKGITDFQWGKKRVFVLLAFLQPFGVDSASLSRGIPSSSSR